MTFFSKSKICFQYVKVIELWKIVSDDLMHRIYLINSEIYHISVENTSKDQNVTYLSSGTTKWIIGVSTKIIIATKSIIIIVVVIG